MNEYLYIQGALQGYRKTFRVTLFLFNNCVSVSMYIEECSLQEVETVANSSILCILMQCSDNSLHSNQIASREKISLGMKLGSLTVSFYIVI